MTAQKGRRPATKERVVRQGDPLEQVFTAVDDVMGGRFMDEDMMAVRADQRNVLNDILQRAEMILNPPPQDMPIYRRRFMFLRELVVSIIDNNQRRVVIESRLIDRNTVGLYTMPGVRVVAITEDSRHDLHIVFSVREYDESQSYYYVWIDFTTLVGGREERADLTATSANVFAVNRQLSNSTVLKLAEQISQDDGRTNRVFERPVPLPRDNPRNHEYPGRVGYDS